MNMYLKAMWILALYSGSFAGILVAHEVAGVTGTICATVLAVVIIAAFVVLINKEKTR